MTRAVTLLSIKSTRSMRNKVTKDKALVMKLEQHSATSSEQEINRLILNGLPSNFDIDIYIFERSQILSLMN